MGSGADGFEEGFALLGGEVLDHELLGWRNRLDATKELLDAELGEGRLGAGVVGSVDISGPTLPSRSQGLPGWLRNQALLGGPCPLRALFDRGLWSLSGRRGQRKRHLTCVVSHPHLVPGSADPALQAGGRGFDSHRLHQVSPGQGVAPATWWHRSRVVVPPTCSFRSAVADTNRPWFPPTAKEGWPPVIERTWDEVVATLSGTRRGIGRSERVLRHRPESGE